MRAAVIYGSEALHFGRSAVITSVEAEPLTYTADFPGRSRLDMTPDPRYITVKGCLLTTADSLSGRKQELELKRRFLASVTAPDKTFTLMIGDRFADCTAGELTLHREAPFSGDMGEDFTLRALIVGGFFRGEPTTAIPGEGISGVHFPLVDEDGVTFGSLDGTSLIHISNGGDVPVGFTAELRPLTTVYSFSLTNTATGEFLTCPHGFGSGDCIRISTHRNDLYFTVIRGNGNEQNMTGFTEEGSKLFLLPTGESTLKLGDGATFTGSLTFSEAFVTF